MLFVLRQEESMIIEVVVPMLGITVEKGKILKWHKSEGDSVNQGGADL